MSGKLLALKKQIKGTKTTRKMTKAMELVASSKMKQFQDKAVNSLKYTSEVSKILSSSISNDIFEDNVYLKGRNGDNNLIVIYSSDKGLCGSMNTRTFKTLKDSDVYNKNALFVVIGKKGRKFVQNNDLNMIKYFSDLSDSTSNIEIVEIVDAVLKIYKEKSNIGQVHMVTPNFKSTLVFYPNVSKFLPLNQEDLEETFDTKKETIAQPILEPAQENIFKKALENYIVSKFYAAFLDLKAVEYSTRMIAMQNATKAADEKVDDLTLAYNKARQAAITQEITEIVNGSAGSGE